MSEMVELIVETEAEVGATGFRVSGGGKEGIFVKEVLKDSRAAKALNLKEGDQLLSAKVYFDNARFEDVVKILQSAESYKVAFCLKRTVPSADVAISSETGNLELRGPESKRTKMSVKSILPVKKTKQFMKGKVLSKEEAAAVELDVPVDVEFAFPKFSKFKRLSITSPKDVEALKGEGAVRHPEVEAELSLGEGQAKGKKKRLRLPAFLASEPGKVKVEVDMEPKEKAAVSVKPLQVAAKEVKMKTKAASFDLLSTSRKVEEDGSKAKSKPKDPGKASVSTGGEAPESRLLLGLPVQAPKVELDIGLSKAEVDLRPPTAEGEFSAKGTGFKVKMPSFERKGAEGAGVSGMKGKIESKEVADQVEGSEGKMKVAQITIPTIDISVPRIKQPDEGVTTSGVEVAVGSYKTLGLEGKIKELAQKVTTFDISAPRVPDVDISLPKGAADVSAGAAGTGKVNVQAGEGTEARLKMPKVSLPEVGLCAKGKEEAAAEAVEVAGQGLKMPSFEVSLPRMKAEDTRAEVTLGAPGAGATGLHISKVKVDIKGPQPEGPEAKIKPPSLKVPTIDIAVPKVTLPEVQLPTGRAEVSKVSMGVPGTGARPPEPGAEELDLQLKLPKVSLPKLPAGGKELGTGGGDAEIRHARIAVPKFEIAIPGMKAAEPEAGLEAGAEVSDPGFRMAKLSGITMPSIDISAPKVKIPDLPTGRAELLAGESGVKKVGGPSELTSEGLDFKLKMPKVSLPSFCEAAGSNGTKAEPGSPGIEGKLPMIDLSALKVKVPEVDIDVQLPKGKALDLIAGADGKAPVAGVDSPLPATEGPDVSFQIPKVSLPTFDICVKSKEAELEAGAKTAEDSAAGSKVPALKMPKVDVALPKVRSSEAEVSGPTVEVDIKREAKGSKGKMKLESPETKLKLPSMKVPKIDMPALQAKVPEVDITLPSVKSAFSAEEEPKVDSHSAAARIEGPSGKVKTPKISLPKFGSKGKEEVVAGGSMPKVELKVTHLEGKGKGQDKGKTLDSGAKGVGVDADIDDIQLKGKEGRFKMPKLKMPTFGTSKKYEEDIEVSIPGARATEAKARSSDMELGGPGGKLKMPKVQMPSIGISVPEIKKPGAEGLLPRAEVDVSEVDLKAYGGELKIPKVKGDMEAAGAEGKAKIPSVKMPAIDISVPKVKAPDVDLSFPVPRIDTTVGGSEGEATLISSETDDVTFRLKMPKLAMPKFGMSGSKDKEPGMDISSTGVGGDYQMDDGDGKGVSFKARMPKVDISLPKVKQSDADVDMDASLLEVEGPDAEAKFKIPGFTLPKIAPPKLKTPELDIDFSLSKDKRVSSETSDAKAGGEVPGGEFKLKMPQVSLPGFGTSASGTDASQPTEKSKPRVKAEVHTPQQGGTRPEGQEDMIIGGRIKMPKVKVVMSKDINEGSKSDSETEGGKLKLKLPTFGILSKSADVEGKDVDRKAKESKLKMSMFGLSTGKDPKIEAGEAGGDSEVDAPKGDKFKVKIPSVIIATPKLEGPDVGLGIGFPKDKDASINRKVKGEMRNGKEERAKGEIQGRVVSSNSPESRFKMPKLTMPDFGMSRKDDEGTATARVKVSEADARGSKVEADAEGQGADAEWKLQVLKMKVPKVEISLSQGESSTGGETAETKAGQKAAGDDPGSGAAPTKVPFKMPSVEISAPNTSDSSAGIEVKDTNMELHSAESRVGLREVDADALELKMPKVTLPTFGVCKEKSEELPGDSGARIEIKGPQIQMDAGDGSESVLSKLKDKMPKVGVELPQIMQQQEVGLSTDINKGESREVSYKSAKVEAGLEGGEVELKARRQLFGFSAPKSKGPEGDVKPPSPRAKDRGKSPAGKGDHGGSSPETDKLRVSWVKKPSFTISWPKSKTMEVNGNGEAGDSTRKEDWEIQRPPKKGSRIEDTEDSDTADGKSKMKLKLPKVSFATVKTSPVNVKTGETPGVHINGESEESGTAGMMGKLKFPKVEFSSPYQKVRDSDTELSLQLVETDLSGSKDDAEFRPHSDESFETSTPRILRGEVKGLKAKSPKITLSGFKKKSGERSASDEEAKMSHLVTSTARSELVFLESGGHTMSKSILGFTSGKSKDAGALSVPSKGLKQKAGQGNDTEQLDSKDTAARFKLPKFSLGTKSSPPEHENNVHSEGQLEHEEGATRHFKLQMPKVGFTTVYQQEYTSDEKIVEEIGSVTVLKGKRQVKTGTLADKSTSI